MKNNRAPIIAALAALTCTVTFAIVQSTAVVHANSPFAGTWEGKLNNHPWIDLKIDDAAGKLSGTIVFYVQERSDGSSPPRVTAEDPVPLLVPRVEGKTLTFEVEYHECRVCVEPGINIKFRVDLAGPDELRLWKLDDREMDKNPGPGLKLIRRTEAAGLQDPSKHHGPLVSVELRLAVDWGRSVAFLRAFRLTLL